MTYFLHTSPAAAAAFYARTIRADTPGDDCFSSRDWPTEHEYRIDSAPPGRIYCEPDQKARPGTIDEPPLPALPSIFVVWLQPTDSVTVNVLADRSEKRLVMELFEQTVRDYGR